METSLQDQIHETMGFLKAKREGLGRSEKSRLLAIVATHLETARLFAMEAEAATEAGED